MSWYDSVDVVITELRGVKVEIRSIANNIEYLRKQAALENKHLTKMQRAGKEPVDTLKRREITAEAMAGTVLVGWDAAALAKAEGVKEPVPFSVDEAKKRLLESGFFFMDVQEIATNRDAYLTENYEILEGKS